MLQQPRAAGSSTGLPSSACSTRGRMHFQPLPPQCSADRAGHSYSSPQFLTLTPCPILQRQAHQAAAAAPRSASCSGLGMGSSTAVLNVPGRTQLLPQRRQAPSATSQPRTGVSAIAGNWATSLSMSSIDLGSEPHSSGPRDLQNLINQIPFKKLAIWSLVLLFAWQLSDFVGIIMGTFIISFVGNSFVDSTQRSPIVQAISPSRTVQRRMLVILYFTMIVAVVVVFGVLTIPDIAREGADFVSRLQDDNIFVVLVDKTRAGLGDQIMEAIEKAVYLASSSDITSAVTSTPAQSWTAERSVALGMTVSGLLKAYTTTAAKITAGMLSSVTRFAFEVFVSLILGFMLVWDMPAIVAGVATLRQSRLAGIYNEVAPVLRVFGKLFGKALEAQARIALVNTALTAAGMWALKIPGMGLLSLFVFICSFIPIAGCIISTVPIGFVALTEYGFIKLGLSILMVCLVHCVEAYALNPAIYSAHLKLHPLGVLSVLVFAEHSMGVWGLLLAVPLSVFAIEYCIRYPEGSLKEVGERKLQQVLQASEEGGGAASSEGQPAEEGDLDSSGLASEDGSGSDRDVAVGEVLRVPRSVRVVGPDGLAR